MLKPGVAGVIGWPVAHSKSPLIHRFWLEKSAIDGDYSRFPVAPDSLDAAVRGLVPLGLRGVNVTVPHKVAVLAFLDTLDARAAAVGAVNLVRVMDDGRLEGGNTDIDGICQPLGRFALAGRAAVIVGAGGAARAAVVAMVQLGVGRISVMVRDMAKGQAMLDDLGVAGFVLPMDAALSGASLLFNATTLGMIGQPPLQIDLGGMAPDGTVFDAVYAPLETPLLAAARRHELKVIDGLEMLIGQAAAAFEWFYGVAAPREHDAELRTLLTA